MPEWSNGAVSKTVELLVGSGGSNPPLSAEDEEKKLSSLLEQLFFFIFCKARRRRVGMCDRREQILPKEGDGRQSRPFFTPFQTFPFGGLSCFAPRGQWSSVSAEFSSPSRSPSVLLPQRQHFPRFSAVAELLFRRILAAGPQDAIVSWVPFHNGSIFRISLPLRNFFSAVSLLWASWTALPPQSPSTTALIPAFPCRCGKNRRAHLPKVS